MSEEMRMDAERAAFEAWADSQWPGAKRQQLKRDNYGEYLNCIYRDMWRGWQARAGLPVGVPDGLRIAIQQRDHYAARVGALELGLLRIADDFYPDNDSEMALALGEMREAVRSLVAAAPTVKESLSVAPTVKAEQAACNCPGGSKPDPSSHAPNCPVRNGEPSTALPIAGAEGVEVVGIVTASGMRRGVNSVVSCPALHRLRPGDGLVAASQHNRIDGQRMAQIERLGVELRAVIGVLSAVQEQFNRYGERFPDGFDGRVFRWVDDAVAGHALSAQQSARLVGGDSVSVPRELLERIANDDEGMATLADFEDLRALLSRNGNGGE